MLTAKFHYPCHQSGVDTALELTGCFSGERLKAGREDLAMVVNAGEADARNLNNEEEEED